MRFHLAIILSLVCGSAMADGNGDVTFSTTVPVGDHPLSIGRPHSCSDAYPQAAIQAHAEGSTTLAFRITTEGAVKNPKVEKSSGNKDLDDASLQCVTRWHYKPATQDGKPIEVSWLANVIWKIGEPPDVRRAAQCFRFRKDLSPIPPSVGATSVAFRVMPDGTMKDAAVTRSSGDRSLDDAAVLCVTASHFDTSIITLPAEGVPGHADLDWAHVNPPPPPVPLTPSK